MTIKSEAVKMISAFPASRSRTSDRSRPADEMIRRRGRHRNRLGPTGRTLADTPRSVRFSGKLAAADRGRGGIGWLDGLLTFECSNLMHGIGRWHLLCNGPK